MLVGRLAAAAAAVSLVATGAAGATPRTSDGRVLPPTALLLRTASHTAELSVDLSKFHDAGFRKYKFYILRGKHAPNALLSGPPHRRPDLTATHRNITKTIHGLKNFTPYNVMAYAYFRHGVVKASDSNSLITVDEGYHVLGQKFYVKNAVSGSLAVDRTGGVHVLAGVHPFAAHKRSVLVYANQSAGSGHWTARQDGTIQDSGMGDITLRLSTDGRRTEALMHTCRGDLTAQTSVKANTMPAPRSLSTYTDCFGQENHDVVATDMATAPHHKAVLIGGVAEGTAAVAGYFTGKPGGTLVGHPLPDGGHDGVDGITRDEATGALVVWGESSRYHFEVWSREPGKAWTAPTPVPAMAVPTEGNANLTLTSWKGKLYGTLDVAGKDDHRGPRDHLYLITRSRSGSWSSYQRLPKTKRFDIAPLPYVDPYDAHLHVVWTRSESNCPVKCSGLMQEKLVKGHWTKPVRLTHWINDFATDVTVPKQGGFVVGYLRE